MYTKQLLRAQNFSSQKHQDLRAAWHTHTGNSH